MGCGGTKSAEEPVQPRPQQSSEADKKADTMPTNGGGSLLFYLFLSTLFGLPEEIYKCANLSQLFLFEFIFFIL